jgi:hypothetical protein
MLEWAQPLDGIKDHSNMPAETTNAYDAEYKKRCVFRGANFVRAIRLKWLESRLVNLNVDLELARNEASHKRVTALEIEIDVMKADKIALETQTAEQRVGAEKEVEDEAQRAAKAAERNCKRAEKEAEEEAQRAEKAAQRDAKWSAEVDASIESMIKGGVSFSKMASKLGLKENDTKSRWHTKLKKSSGIIKPPVQTGFPSRITWTEDVDASIVRMRADDISYAKIALKLGNGLVRNDIINRWNRHLKDKLP